MFPNNYIQEIPSSEANSHSASQEIPIPLWNLEVHHYVHKSPSLALILGQVNPVHTVIFNSLKSHFNIIFPSTTSSSE